MTIQDLTTSLTRIWATIATTHQHGLSSRAEALTGATQVGGSTYQAESARAEGWGVFFCGERADGSPCYELQALDRNLPGDTGFEDDVRAWEHVVTQARAGSTLHRAALLVVDPVELRLIRYWCSAEDLVL